MARANCLVWVSVKYSCCWQNSAMKADDSYYTASEDMSVDKDHQSFTPWVFLYSSLLLRIQITVNILLIFLIVHAVNLRNCLEMYETFKNSTETFIVDNTNMRDPFVQNLSHVAKNCVFHICTKRRRCALIWCKNYLFMIISSKVMLVWMHSIPRMSMREIHVQSFHWKPKHTPWLPPLIIILLWYSWLVQFEQPKNKLYLSGLQRWRTFWGCP